MVDEQKCTLTGHSEPVLSVTYSPDGKHIASGSDDRTVKVWNAATGKTVRTVFGLGVSFSAACADADVRGWAMSRSAR